MTNKGSALMQVMVVGLIVAAFSVLMLRYAVTRSANLARTERVLESQILADSCLDQYMTSYANAALSGTVILPTDSTFACKYFPSEDKISDIEMSSVVSSDGGTRTVRFVVPVQ